MCWARETARTRAAAGTASARALRSQPSCVVADLGPIAQVKVPLSWRTPRGTEQSCSDSAWPGCARSLGKPVRQAGRQAGNGPQRKWLSR